MAGKTVFQSQGPLSVFTLRETRLQSAYMDSINTTLNVIFADGKKSSVNSNYYNLRNSVPLLSAYHKTKGDAVSRISSCVSDHSKVL